MKVRLTRLVSSILLTLPLVSMAAPNPASQDWVNANFQPLLTAPVWDAVCTSGSPASGCYGNVSSNSFTLLNALLGGFTSYANINLNSGPTNSVFIKSFFAGTNTPVSPTDISVGLTGTDLAKCALFVEAGAGLNYPEGIANNISATTYPETIGPEVPQITPVTSVGTTIPYSYSSSLPAIAINTPVYLVCVGVSGSDFTSVAALNGVTAV